MVFFWAVIFYKRFPYLSILGVSGLAE